MIKLNKANLVCQAVLGEVAPPLLSTGNPYRVGADGVPRVLPGTGGITYNVTVGDSAIDFVGDHVEPGVSVKATDAGAGPSANGALNVLSCIGNEAVVISGEARGAKGFVTGKHGGVNHVLVDLPPRAIDRLAIGDRIQVRSVGTGLTIEGFHEVHVMNIAPDLFLKMGIKTVSKQLSVPVTHTVPASLMGSGLGSIHSSSGDYDIQLFDEEVVKKFGLMSLRLGDVVAIRDARSHFGRSFKTDAVTIGIVVHASSTMAGHGPGVTTILSDSGRNVVTKVDQQANIGRYLGIGRTRSSGRPSRGGRSGSSGGRR
jgi:hypothetical protein